MAALGTQMFWTTLRPLAGMAAILLFFMLGDKSGMPDLAAVPVVFLVFYNIVSLPVRFLFIVGAAEQGLDFFYVIKRFNPNKAIWYCQIAGVAMALAAVFFYYKNFIGHDMLMAHLFPSVVILTAALHIFFKKVSGLKIFYAVLLLGVILGYMAGIKV
jgi:mannose/fructose/N-acetylgalactosamine-specific phosphotransferase system component IID